MSNKHFEDPFLNILPKIDLHGETKDMIRYLLLDFIRTNRILGNLKVQIIHGRHGGVLKRETHDILKNIEGVERYYLYGFNDGITIVELRPIDKNS